MRIQVLAAVGAALLVTPAMPVPYAGFSATTANADNSFRAATLAAPRGLNAAKVCTPTTPNGSFPEYDRQMYDRQSTANGSRRGTCARQFRRSLAEEGSTSPASGRW